MSSRVQSAQAQPPVEDGDATASVGAPAWAKAYCGAAHGACWSLDEAQEVPPLVTLNVGDDRLAYRLVHHPRTHRPVRDHLGNYLYLPVRQALQAPLDSYLN